MLNLSISVDDPVLTSGRLLSCVSRSIQPTLASWPGTGAALRLSRPLWKPERRREPLYGVRVPMSGESGRGRSVGIREGAPANK